MTNETETDIGLEREIMDAGPEKRELSAAQKKREKQKLKKKLAKESSLAGGEEETGGPHLGGGEGAGHTAPELDEGDHHGIKNKGKSGPKEKYKKGPKGKGPSKAQITAIQAAIQKAKEEEELFLREEEEKERQREEAEALRLAKLKEEQERKEKKKLKEKERKARLREEGKLLTPKQKQEKQRAQQLLESLKAQGAPLPAARGEKKFRPGARVRPKKTQGQQSPDTEHTVKTKESFPLEEAANSESECNKKSSDLDLKPAEVEKVKDAWDDEGTDDEQSTDNTVELNADTGSKVDRKLTDSEAYSETSSEEEGSHENTDQSKFENKDERDREKDISTLHKKEDPQMRIGNRRRENHKSRSKEVLRSPVVCVLGHVDTGKTKLLDKLRRTHVQDGEAGGITQQIGATNVPIEAIRDAAKFVKGFADIEVKVPGLLLIDTPGHESFSNLRSRGSSLCDVAILVVDIMHGIERQTIESINLLKGKGTPFLVALNKIDKIYDWKSNPKRDIRDVISCQSKNSLAEFRRRTNEIIVQFAEQGLNASLFYENPDPEEFISMIPTSAGTGEGMGNLMSSIIEYSQNLLVERLMYSDELQGTVMEVKAIPGLGTTIDVILINGTLKEGETLVLAGTDGPIVTQIRSLLTPQPLKELRVKNTYLEYGEIKGAIGVKVAATDLETAIAGLNVQVAYHLDEVEICKQEISREMKTALSSFRLQERGVYVLSSTLGSLEALLDFLRTSSIPYSGVRIGPVVKKDVVKASVMLEHDSQYAVILAFDVKVEKDAQDLANHVGIRIFQADIIYHLFDKFIAYKDELTARKREEFKHVAVFPCKLKILPEFVFNTRNPILVGVSVEEGMVKVGTPLCVPLKECLEIGKVASIELNHKPAEKASKGQEACIKIEPIPGESPKMLGRHFEITDLLVSKITRESIDACKDYFRNDLQKSDWQLIVELKKKFEIV